MSDDAGTFEIEFLSGPRDGEVVPLPPGETIIGRDGACGLPLPFDPVVSRRHARLRCGGEVVLEDLQSSFGTFVNEEHVRDPVRLEATDIVRAGHTEFVCRRAGAEGRDGLSFASAASLSDSIARGTGHEMS